MRYIWQPTTLGEIATIGAGNSAPQDKTLFAHGSFPFFRTSDIGQVRFGIITESRDYLNESGIKGLRKFPKGTILVPKSGASTFLNHRVMLGVEGYVSSHLATINAHPNKVIDKYLLYYLSTIAAQDLIQDHSYPSLNLPMISAIPIDIPPLPEQKHIVAKLDEVFIAVTKLKENTEKNAVNARAIFQSELNAVFTRKTDKWFRTTVGDQVVLQRGFDITKRQQNNGSVPVVSSGGIKSYHDTAMAEGPGVVIGRKGTLGKTFYINEAYWPHDTTLWVKDFKGNIPLFVYYFFVFLDVSHLDSGAANPALNRNQVHPIKTYWPPPEEQPKIVEHLNSLVEEVNRVTDIYQRKICQFENLRQSLLRHAFNGQL